MTQDSLIVMTPHQLKVTNILLTEREQYSKENVLLRSQNLDLFNLNKQYIISDSLKTKQINMLKQKVEEDKLTIQTLQSSLTKSNNKVRRLRNLTIGGIS